MRSPVTVFSTGSPMSFLPDTLTGSLRAVNFRAQWPTGIPLPPVRPRVRMDNAGHCYSGAHSEIERRTFGQCSNPFHLRPRLPPSARKVSIG